MDPTTRKKTNSGKSRERTGLKGQKIEEFERPWHNGLRGLSKGHAGGGERKRKASLTLLQIEEKSFGHLGNRRRRPANAPVAGKGNREHGQGGEEAKRKEIACGGRASYKKENVQRMNQRGFFRRVRVVSTAGVTGTK